jgi:homogentisate phytyltransferase/homogentisate geranylgeranyltransferase
MKEFLINFVRFSRLHTVIGTFISITALCLMAWALARPEPFPLSLWAWTLVSCLGANIFIVGLNQITDVEIDRINKPYLPLASGAFSMRTGYLLIGISVVISLTLAILWGPFLLATVVLSLFLGTIYSLPPIRLKRFYFWAAFCIIAVRGLIVNLLLFLHFHSILNGQSTITPSVWLLTGLMLVFGLIIAWFKDMPDLEGDEQFEIRTLSLKWGVPSVFRWGNVLLLLSLATTAAMPFVLEMQLRAWPFAIVQGVIMLLLIAAGQRVNLREQKSIFAYYRFVWVLFFLEYIIFGVASL